MRVFLLHLIKALLLFFIFGFIYIVAELVYRQHSHITMFICGGLSSLEIGLLNEFPKYKRKLNLFLQMLIGSAIITVNEFIFGLIFNVWLKYDIWDYSELPFNILGQICLEFSLLWFLLSYFIIKLDDLREYKVSPVRKTDVSIINEITIQKD